MNVVAIGVLFAGLLVGCAPTPEPMPEVTAENCRPERIQQIRDEATRREFGSRCSRLPAGPDTLPTNPKRW